MKIEKLENKVINVPYESKELGEIVIKIHEKQIELIDAINHLNGEGEDRIPSPSDKSEEEGRQLCPRCKEPRIDLMCIGCALKRGEELEQENALLKKQLEVAVSILEILSSIGKYNTTCEIAKIVRDDAKEALTRINEIK